MSTAVEKVLGRADDHSYDDSMRWSKLDQNIYAYKEFVEKYEEAGIAGYIIYIDGFVPEKPDENLKSTEIMDKIPYENNPSGKQNAKISIDESSGGGLNYKQVKISNLDDPLAQLPSQYIEETYSEVASERGNNKYKAESLVKYLASGSIYLDNIVSDKLDTDSLIFIKEGTILGRTMTDKELLESSDFRSNETGTYKENREVSLEINKEGADIIIGNYIRVMMRDHDKTIVENIEDFYKLGDKEDYSWFEILFWVPYESDGVDVPLGGPECVSTCTPGELAVGIAQWTDLLDHYHEGRDGNGINSVLRRCVKNDYDLCWPLEEQIKGNVERWCETTGDEFKTETNPHYEKKQISAKTGKEFDGLKGKFDICIKREPDKDLYGYGYDYKGEVIPEAVLEIHCRWDGHEDLKAEAEENIRKSPLQEALSKVCKMNREKFFKLQRQLAKESFLDPILLEHPWLEDRPLCVQGALMHTYLAGDQTMKWLDESQTNEEILQCVRHYIAHRKSTAGDDGNKSRAWSEPEIAYKLLDGTLSKYEVEVWTRESTSQILEAAGMKFKGTYDD